jgi:phosphatidylglycerol---prolipoprotein diacylglyceryl transferase
MGPVIASVGWPVRARVFGFSPHGVFIAIGFAIGAWLFGRLAPRRGISVDAVNSIVFWSLIGAIVGARVAYVVAHASDFGSPVQWLEVWKGGISLLGGIAGATIANAINIRRFGLRFFQVADALTAPLALGIAVGRIGDLIIGDHLGKPTSWFLAWTYHGGTLAPPWSCGPDGCQAELQGQQIEIFKRAGAAVYQAGHVPPNFIPQGIGVHQTAMYDMLIAWTLFAFLWWFIRQPRREGIATLVFAISYGCARLLEDFLRIDKRFGPLTGSQWTALTVVVVSVLVWAAWAITKRPGPTTPGRQGAPPETTDEATVHDIAEDPDPAGTG